MGWIAHKIRHIPGVLALAGMAFYAVLIPWHTVSQATAQSAQSQRTTAINSPCHEIGKAPAKQRDPIKPQTNCPICKGFAKLQFATSASPTVLAFAFEVVEPFTAISAECVQCSRCESPPSRAPPSFSL
jgi:hypothetical protein